MPDEAPVPTAEGIVQGLREHAERQHCYYAATIQAGGALPPECLVITRELFSGLVGQLGASLETIAAARRDFRAFRRGPAAKRKRRAERHEAIESLLRDGFTTPEEMFQHLQEQRPELVRKGKGWIKPDWMMRDFRSARGRHPCGIAIPQRNCNSAAKNS
jgi:hypothetical protein